LEEAMRRVTEMESEANHETILGKVQRQMIDL
jgi:hypothetical protein